MIPVAYCETTFYSEAENSPYAKDGKRNLIIRHVSLHIITS